MQSKSNSEGQDDSFTATEKKIKESEDNIKEDP